MPNESHRLKWCSADEQTQVYHFCGKCGASIQILPGNLRTLPPNSNRTPCRMCEWMVTLCTGDCEPRIGTS